MPFFKGRSLVVKIPLVTPVLLLAALAASARPISCGTTAWAEGLVNDGGVAGCIDAGTGCGNLSGRGS